MLVQPPHSKRYTPRLRAATEERARCLSLARGVLRALTGLIAGADPSHVGVTTPTATLGVRGTGFDMVCEGACGEGADGTGGPDDRLRVCTWRGAVDS